MKKRLPKKKKKLFAIRYSLFAILLIILLGIGWQIYGGLRKSVWDGENRISLVLNSQPVLIASFSPKKNSLDLLLIPDKTFIEATHGYGLYRIESIWELGELENRPALLAESCQEYLGLVIDGWIDGQPDGLVLPVAGEEKEKLIKESLRSRFFQLIKRKSDTNLTRWDLIRLWWQTGKVRFDKINLIDLKETSAILATSLPDGTQGFEIDQNRLDNIVARYFQDEKIKEEGIIFEIANGTDHFGLAAQGMRLINNLGGRVIGISDWDLRSEKCEVRSVKEKRESHTLKKLMGVFDCQFGDKGMGDSRAEAVIILGENYWRKLNKK